MNAPADMKNGSDAAKGVLKALNPVKYFETVDEIRQANDAAGFFFFKSSKAWGARYRRRIYGGRYFVSSEKPFDAPRTYTVRRAEASGAISTVGALGAYETAAEAEAAAAAAAATD